MASHNHYLNYYLHQAQTGGSMGYYAGAAHQRGTVFFGNLLSGLFRFVSPLLPSLGREALRAGGHVLSDVASGSDSLKSSVTRHASEAGQNLLNRAVDKLQGRGIKRKRLTHAAHSHRGSRSGRVAPKRTKRYTASDIFG